MKARSKLSSAAIEHVKDLYYDYGFQQGDIAQIFNCDQGHISRIVNNKNGDREANKARQFKAMYDNVRTIKSKKPQAKAHLTLLSKGKHPSAKLDWKKVNQIRDAYYFQDATQAMLAKQFKVHQATIHRITTGQKWKDQINL